jgi:hypothetical protein
MDNAAVAGVDGRDNRRCACAKGREVNHMRYYKIRLRKRPQHGDEDPRIVTVEAVSETLKTITMDTGLTVQRVHEHGCYYPSREDAVDALMVAQLERIRHLESSLAKARERLREIDNQGTR